MAEKKLPSFDFKKMTREELHDFLKANATPEEIASFKAVAFVPTPKKVMKPEMVTGEDGKPTQKIVRRKQSDGSYKLVPKMVAVAVKGSDLEPKYSHRKAINWFCETYVDIPNPKAIMTNRPKRTTNKKISADDLFSDLW